MATYSTGGVLDTGSGNIQKLWKGDQLTNGFLLRDADGRIPALKIAGTLKTTYSGLPTDAKANIPFGFGVFRIYRKNVSTTIFGDENTFHVGVTRTSGASAENEHVEFIGVVNYEQGWAESNPVVNWGIPNYSKFSIIKEGYVGYKVTRKSDGTTENFINYLAGDRGSDATGAIKVYSNWLALLRGNYGTESGHGDGKLLCLDIEIATGVPVINYDLESATPSTGFVRVGYAAMFEPENEAVYFKLDGKVKYYVAPAPASGV